MRRGDYAVKVVREEYVITIINKSEVCVRSRGRQSILIRLLATSSLNIT